MLPLLRLIELVMSMEEFLAFTLDAETAILTFLRVGFSYLEEEAAF